MAVLTVDRTACFPTAAEGYDRACVDAAFETERRWRRELEERAEMLLREAAALHLAIATHAVDPVDEPARLVAVEIAAKPRAIAEEPTTSAQNKREAAAERRKASAAAKKETALAEELKTRQAEEKRQAAAERRKAAAAVKKEAARAEELKARQAEEKRQAAAERRKAAAAARKAQQEQGAVERAVREEIERATAEVAAMKAELERMKALHGERPSSARTVPAQTETVHTVPPAAAAFAASAGAAWARRTSESTMVRRAEPEKPRPAKASAAVAAPAAVSLPMLSAAPPVEGTLQEVPAARTGGRFTKRIVLRKPVTTQPDAAETDDDAVAVVRTPVTAGAVPLLTPAAGGRVESRVIRLG